MPQDSNPLSILLELAGFGPRRSEEEERRRREAAYPYRLPQPGERGSERLRIPSVTDATREEVEALRRGDPAYEAQRAGVAEARQQAQARSNILQARERATPAVGGGGAPPEMDLEQAQRIASMLASMYPGPNTSAPLERPWLEQPPVRGTPLTPSGPGAGVAQSINLPAPGGGRPPVGPQIAQQQTPPHVPISRGLPITGPRPTPPVAQVPPQTAPPPAVAQQFPPTPPIAGYQAPSAAMILSALGANQGGPPVTMADLQGVPPGGGRPIQPGPVPVPPTHTIGPQPLDPIALAMSGVSPAGPPRTPAAQIAPLNTTPRFASEQLPSPFQRGGSGPPPFIGGAPVEEVDAANTIPSGPFGQGGGPEPAPTPGGGPMSLLPPRTDLRSTAPSPAPPIPPQAQASLPVPPTPMGQVIETEAEKRARLLAQLQEESLREAQRKAQLAAGIYSSPGHVGLGPR